MKLYQVSICFGPPTNMLTDDMLKDLQEAVEHASHNLYCKHRIKISVGSPKRQDEYSASLELIDTKEILKEKTIPMHLKGIAGYLLSTYPEKYEPLKYGNRLLYCDVL